MGRIAFFGWFLAAAALLAGLPVASLSATTPQEVMVLELVYQQSERRWFNDRSGFFESYLGTGNGRASGRLDGRIGWDLYEDQKLDDFHPAHLHGFIEQDGVRHEFQVIGIYTPVTDDHAVTPDGKTHPKIWALSGAIVFDDTAVLGARHLPVTGIANLETWTATYSVWSTP